MTARGSPRFWEQGGWPVPLLTPLEGVYRMAVAARRGYYRRNPYAEGRLPAPVLVVGNLTVGGTGKTPLVIWLVEKAHSLGHRPGVILRGHGGRRPGPEAVSPQSDPREVGDEAVLIARRTHCPVVIGRDRPAAGKALLDRGDVDLVISDDGLQHYPLGRDGEIAVVDARRGLGNGHCLPAGPLREPPARLQTVDLILANGSGWPGADGEFELRPADLLPLTPTSATQSPPQPGQTVHAVAGIGHPERFFTTLESLGFRVTRHAFADHHGFQPADLEFATNGQPLIMTEKDAVKCHGFPLTNSWILPVYASPDEPTQRRLTRLLGRITHKPAGQGVP
ncbi:tetraacyldisaccharide 4'-kinase [Spiribacter sp. 2438]|uniref:tetraacyldisaccharide 4'-kinase n=1 Tax=Spiribacter sp. 2438 TaxID=2666185 RepID=UPI001E64DD8D|nr:tetraacyldisaccharide 4'-kinase [Spiribacter sp. 2438]